MENSEAEQKISPDSVPYSLINNPMFNQNGDKEIISFQSHSQANPESRLMQLKRFQQNPLPNWGPKARGTANTSDFSKRIKNQGKKRRKRDEENISSEQKNSKKFEADSSSSA